MAVLEPHKAIIESFDSAVRKALSDLPTGGPVVAAVSGGADSCAMLVSLSRVCRFSGMVPHCVHIVHGIRPAAEGAAEALHVRALCERVSVPCSVVEIPRGEVVERAARTGKGIEDAARYFRHRALRAEARRLGASRIMIAHTSDDRLETALMRFLKGAGPAGLAAIPRDNGTIARPLIELSRAEVLRYLDALDIPYKDDPSNSDLRFLRNRVRRRLIPLLDECFSGWRSAVLASARTQAAVASFISEEADERIRWSKPADDPAALATDAEPFWTASPVLRTESLFHAMDRIVSGAEPVPASPDAMPRKDRVPSRAVLDSFVSGPGRAQDLGPVRVSVDAGEVRVEPARASSGEPRCCLCVASLGRFFFRGLRFSVSETERVGAIAVLRPFVLRTPLSFEKTAIREVLPARAATSGLVSVIEDRAGFAGAIFGGQGEKPSLVSAKRKECFSDYTEFDFFSIL